MVRMFWGDLKAEPQPHLLSKLPLVGKQQEEAPHAPLPPPESGSRLQVLRPLRPQGLASGLELPPQPFPRLLHPQRRGTVQGYILLQQMLLFPDGLGPKPCRFAAVSAHGSWASWTPGTLRGPWERLRSFSPQCNVTAVARCLSLLTGPPRPPPARSHYPWCPMAELCRGRLGEHLGPQPPVPEADKHPARGAACSVRVLVRCNCHIHIPPWGTGTEVLALPLKGPVTSANSCLHSGPHIALAVILQSRILHSSQGLHSFFFCI